MPTTHSPLRILHTAEILLPMGGQPPIRDAGVIVDDEGRILEYGEFTSLTPGYDMRYAHSLLMPGVLNCHIHLTDAARNEPVPGGEGLVRWVQNLLATRREETPETTAAAMIEVLRRMRELGTAAIGEVANNLESLEPIRRSGLRCRFIHELIGFRKDRAQEFIQSAQAIARSTQWDEDVAYTVGAHAPYSVSPELMREIENLNKQLGTFTYQHLAEDPDERLLYQTASGPWTDFLKKVGAWEPTWSGTGESPIEFYDRFGLLNDRLVAVHLADATADEIALLGERGVKAILSPTSNLHITGRLPDLEAIVRAGMTIGLGTDGRGSNPSIDVFDEAALLLQQWPDLKPGLMLESLTMNGAELLGFADMGSIAVGNRPGLVAVSTRRIGTNIQSLESSILLEAAERTRVA